MKIKDHENVIRACTKLHWRKVQVRMIDTIATSCGMNQLMDTYQGLVCPVATTTGQKARKMTDAGFRKQKIEINKRCKYNLFWECRLHLSVPKQIRKKMK